MPKKLEIINLYNNNNYEEFQIVLDDYLKLLEQYASKGLGIVFDPIIFEITIELLVKTNKKDIARKYIKYAPKEHLIPLKDDLGME